MTKRFLTLCFMITLAITAWGDIVSEVYDFKGLNTTASVTRGESLGFTVKDGNNNRTIYSFTIADQTMDCSRFGAFIGSASDTNIGLKTSGLLLKGRILSILNLRDGDKVKIEYKLASGGSLTLADATLIGNTTDNNFESGTEYTISTTAESVHLDIISSANNNYITKITVTPYHKITVPGEVTGGSVTADKKKAASGETVTLTISPNDGYTLKEGTLAATYKDGEATQSLALTDNSFTMPSYNVTVSAEFELKDVTISFDSNGGSAVQAITQKYGTDVSAPTDPKWDGHTFDGWFLENATSAYEFSTMPAEDITLVAHWTEDAAQTYPVTVQETDADGNKVEVDKANPTAEETITITITPSSGKQLSGSPTVTETGGSTIIDVTKTSDNVYTFTMPAYPVTVSATFENTPSAETVSVFLTAGQSNTAGRCMNENLPDYIKTLGTNNNGTYQYCNWSYTNGSTRKSESEGVFRKFWPEMESAGTPGRFAYDAIVYYWIEQALQKDFYVVKHAQGGTSIDPSCTSTNDYHWSADATWLAEHASCNTDGGTSMLKAFCDNIGASLDALATDNKTYDIKAMIWHQGESDRTGTAPDDYHDNLAAVVQYVRNYLVTKTGNNKYATLDFICGTVPKESKQYNKKVYDALFTLAQEDSHFHVIETSPGTFIGDQLHFDTNCAERLGIGIYNKMVDLGLVSGTKQTVPEVIYPEGQPVTLDFKTWATENVGDKTVQKALTLSTESIKALDGTTDLYKAIGCEADGDFSEFAETFALSANEVKMRGAVGLQLASNKVVTFSILNLNPGDGVTITFGAGTSGTTTLAALSENIFVSDDATQTVLAAGTALTSKTVTYVVKSGNQIDLTFGSTGGHYINSIVITPDAVEILPTKPTVTLKTDGTEEKVYTVTFSEGETLHYSSPNTTEEQTVAYSTENNGSVDITVTKTGDLVCWTTRGTSITESDKNTTTVTFSSGEEPTTAITIHTIGDSTMSHYDQSVAAQKGMDGWGDYLGDCMKEEWVTVKNWADRGETAKSYYNGYWNGTKPDERPDFTQEINKEVNAGDYVIIQFGHNDSKAYDTTTYEEWLGKLVDAVKEKGATPIMAGSICRARFDSNGKITRLGRIDTGEENGVGEEDHTYDYPYHAKAVATAKDIEFIDVTSGVKEMFETYGEAKTKALFPSGEKTHTNKLGAQLIAKVAAKLLLNTVIANYVDQTTLELPSADDIDVVIDNFGTEATVTKKTIWTFNDVESGTAISDGSNEIVNRNGLYVRGRADARAINAVASNLTSVTFSDNTEQTVSIMAQTAGANTATESTIGQNTAGRAAANGLAPMFALNIATPGTFYAIMAPTKKAADRNINLFFSGKLVESKVVNDVYDATTDHLCELKYHAETTGVIYLSAGVISNLYAAMFVPDMEAGTEEDWNYQMVKTGENGYWTYTNLSGGNQSVPEGLTAYAISEINSAGKAVLADYGNVIANGSAVLVKGEPNTEYALPSTTDASTHTGDNLLMGNSTLRYLPATENGKTNYYFDGTQFVKATGGETIHEKQAYLSVVSSDANSIPLYTPEDAPTTAVTYDFMAAYAADNNITPVFSETDVTVYYNRDTDETGTKRSGSSYPMEVNTTELPVNGTISCFNKDQTITEKGLNTKASRPFAIHNLKVGDVIRIEFDGALYYAKSTYNGGKGNALEGLTTGDIIKNLKDYTVSSIDAENNYVVFFPTATTTISQISINEELTMKFVPKPTVSTTYTENEDSYTYAISYQDGATLHYTLPGGEEQTKVGGETLNVNVTKIGDLTAYATINTMTSETTSQRVYAPTPAIASGEVYDFALVKEAMLKDYTLGTHGYGDAITIGSVAMKKPDAVVAKTLDRFAFTSEYTEEETTKDGKEWVLLSAGRLRAKASAHDDKMAILNVKKGQYLTLTYSGAAIKYLAGGTATMTESTDTLYSKKAYEILTDGNLLLIVTANTEKNCDITGISLASTEVVSAPTIEARDEINKVTLHLGTSSFGKTVTAYYTLDGSTPTTSSTAMTKNGAITVDESCTMKAYCVSETGVASGVTEYTVSLPAASKSASKVYDWLNVVQHGDEIAFATDGLTVYDKEYDATNGWVTKKRTDFNAATSFDSKVSVRSGASGVTYDSSKKTIRLTKPLAIHNLAVDDEIVIIYTGDGSLYSGAADEGDAFTINGKTGTAGTAIPSGAVLKVTKQKYENNYVVVTPSGTGSGKVFISAIYINHSAPNVANTPKCDLINVNLDKMESTYRFTFDEGAMLYYMNTADNETLAGSNTGTFDITVTESAKLKAWEVNGTLTSDTLSVTVYTPTPAPSTTGNFDFTEASEDLPADIEVTLDASKPVTVGGETLYKPSALTAATFGDKFAFTETGSSNKIRIRTNHQLVFAKGTNMSMGLLNLKKGDIISFDYTGTITFANPSQVSVESSVVAARGMTRAVSSDLTSGTAYIVQADGDILLNLSLTEASANISKMYIAAAPTTSAAKALDFATAAEEYEDVETGNSISVWFNGKTSAQTFKRLINDSDELPIDGKVSTESGSGEITIDGIKASNRHLAIHNLAVGDEILVRFYGGALTYDGHESKGNRVKVNGKTLAVQDTLTSGDVIVVEKVDYLNNYVVLKLDSKCSISGIFINREEIEKVWAPTIVESGKNTVLITAGRSSMDNQVTTYYTTDGTDPSDRNGIGGPYESYDVELLDGALVPVKAISYSSSGKVSNITTFNIFADMRTEIIGVPVENSKEQVIYDLQGRKVETPMEGRIYIIDGKKVLYRRK